MTGTLSSSQAAPLNPLNEASPQSLDELFRKQPPYSDDDMRRLVDVYRKQRANWQLAGGDQTVKRGKTQAPPQPKAPKVKRDDISLDDLDLS